MDGTKKRTRGEKDTSDSSASNTPPNTTNSRVRGNKPKVMTRKAKDTLKEKEKEQIELKKPKKPSTKPSKKKANLQLEATTSTPKVGNTSEQKDPTKEDNKNSASDENPTVKQVTAVNPTIEPATEESLTVGPAPKPSEKAEISKTNRALSLSKALKNTEDAAKAFAMSTAANKTLETTSSDPKDALASNTNIATEVEIPNLDDKDKAEATKTATYEVVQPQGCTRNLEKDFEKSKPILKQNNITHYMPINKHPVKTSTPQIPNGYPKNISIAKIRENFELATDDDVFENNRTGFGSENDPKAPAKGDLQEFDSGPKLRSGELTSLELSLESPPMLTQERSYYPPEDFIYDKMSQSDSEAERVQNEFNMKTLRDIATKPGQYTYHSSSDLMETTSHSLDNSGNMLVPRQTPPVISTSNIAQHTTPINPYTPVHDTHTHSDEYDTFEEENTPQRAIETAADISNMVDSIFQSKISHYIAAVETGVNENVKKYMKTIEDGIGVMQNSFGIIEGRATVAMQLAQEAQETSKLNNSAAKNLDETAKNHLVRINGIEERVSENWGKEGEFKNLNENLQKVQNKLRQTEHDLEVFRREAEQKESDRAFKILNYDTYSIRNLYDEKLIDAVINILMDGYPEHLQNKKTFEWIRDQIDDVAFNHNDKRKSTPVTVYVQNKASRSFIYSYYKQERTKHKATVTQYLPPRLYHIHERLRMAGKKYKQDHPNSYTRVATVRSQTKATYMRYVLQVKDSKEAPWRII